MPEVPENPAFTAAVDAMAADADGKKKRKLVALNPAMAAVAAIEEILDTLPAKDAARVLDWINDSYSEVKVNV